MQVVPFKRNLASAAGSAGMARRKIGDYLTISRRRRSEYRLVITEPEATNCFSINFQVFTNNNPHNFIKIHFK
jgi:hypothetical protein